MNKLETAVFGGGCFWCTEAVFQRLKGVESVVSGYAGGDMKNPTYEQVSNGNTGHAEVIKVEFDPQVIAYSDLLNVFFAMHDPTTLNQQGNDIGEQYRSVIFYSSEGQKKRAEEFIQELENDNVFSEPIVTSLEPLSQFYPAENYHQNYYDNNRNKPYCQAVINPKVAKLRQKFAMLLKP
ncbi:MAG TPA: peptide-methionine (S)-S-oxide reductase MsrA [Verrucomicrobiae bacterium]|nr:peptide-methionine (S)-S-oxide reductase MsrA [Verrucomicrobiae bacterium]